MFQLNSKLQLKLVNKILLDEIFHMPFGSVSFLSSSTHGLKNMTIFLEININHLFLYHFYFIFSHYLFGLYTFLIVQMYNNYTYKIGVPVMLNFGREVCLVNI